MGTYVIIERDGTTSVIHDAIGIKNAIDIFFRDISTNIQEGFSIHQVTHQIWK